MRFASRVDCLPISGIRKLNSRIKGKKNVINLSIGQPDFSTPQNIANAAIKAIKEGRTKYTDEEGIEEIRTAFSKKYNKTYKLKITEKQVLVTTGACEGINTIISCLVNVGDEVIITDPGYIFYQPLVRFYGGIPRLLSLSPENDFIPKKEDIKNIISKKTKLIIINSPNNPTGAVYSKSILKYISDLAKEYNFYIFSDEVYHEIIYDSVIHHSMLEFDKSAERTIVANSLSKSYAMTGFRIGFLISNRETISTMCRVHYYYTACANTIGQFAGVEALYGQQKSVLKMKEEYNRRKKFIVNALQSMKHVSCNVPQGAFYIFPKIDVGLKSEDLAIKLLDEIGVVTVPGNAFGENGEGFLRLSYSVSMDMLKEAVRRMEKWLKNR